MKSAFRSGQILILVLLIVVVALAVGLSVASRNITNLKTSTQTEQSQRAFTAAEGGVEDVLSRLSTIAQGIPVGNQTTVNVPVGDITANVNVKASGIYSQEVKLGDVAQIDLNNAYTSGVRTVVIEWAKIGTPEVSPAASIEITFVCQKDTSCFGLKTGSGSGYTQERFAIYVVAPTDGSNESGFVQCGSTAPPVASLPNISPFGCQAKVTLPNDNVILARIRPFHKATTVNVHSGDTEPALPVQSYDITSKASTDAGVTRSVNVQRTVLPQLPAAFDYVLFSESDIIK